ncbi:hypothetical protein [Curtobacterium pusillum]|uniref:hypothetical protein n=1 Tax=Curtobacterium pusillum TaxID=69373 RepID=UPI00119D2807|nr:hypothetical protein [Curtobacterium pusillum]
MITPEDLLAGPRGRRFCLGLLRRVLDQDTGPGEELHATLFWAGYHLGQARGGGGVLFGPGAAEPHPHPSTADVAAALAAAVSAADLAATTVLEALQAVADAAAFARYWQEPDAEDVLLASSGLAAPLRALASAVAASPAVTALGVDHHDAPQWAVEFDEPDRGTGTGDTGAAAPGAVTAARRTADWQRALLAEVAAVRPSDRRRPAASHRGGEWWSTPPWGLLVTTAALDDGPVGLWAVEDDQGWDRALVSPVTAPPDARVAIVDDAEDWADLCRVGAVDVSGTTRRHDWYWTTGRDGDWITPDWAAIARAYDAVHLTFRGWLRAAGTAVPVDASTASVIAGWTPGSTVWLRDPQPGLGASAAWRWDDEAERWIAS